MYVGTSPKFFSAERVALPIGGRWVEERQKLCSRQRKKMQLADSLRCSTFTYWHNVICKKRILFVWRNFIAHSLDGHLKVKENPTLKMNSFKYACMIVEMEKMTKEQPCVPFSMRFKNIILP